MTTLVVGHGDAGIFDVYCNGHRAGLVAVDAAPPYPAPGDTLVVPTPPQFDSTGVASITAYETCPPPLIGLDAIGAQHHRQHVVLARVLVIGATENGCVLAQPGGKRALPVTNLKGGELMLWSLLQSVHALVTVDVGAQCSLHVISHRRLQSLAALPGCGWPVVGMGPLPALEYMPVNGLGLGPATFTVGYCNGVVWRCPGGHIGMKMPTTGQYVRNNRTSPCVKCCHVALTPEYDLQVVPITSVCRKMDTFRVSSAFAEQFLGTNIAGANTNAIKQTLAAVMSTWTAILVKRDFPGFIGEGDPLEMRTIIAAQ